MKRIVGFWNPSVILTYLGACAAVLGMAASFREGGIRYAFICLVICGVCDLFDGALARKVKRNEAEKAFGIQIDSLTDMMGFVALPIVIFLALGLTQPLCCMCYAAYAVAGIARLGYFNVETADSEAPAAYYAGLPVTYAALIFPVAHLLIRGLSEGWLAALSMGVMLAVTVLELLTIRIAKPRGLAYAFFSLLAIGVIAAFLSLP